MKTVFVFKTSVSQLNEVYKLKPILNQIVQKDEQWNFDLEDCDHILRVETYGINKKRLIEQTLIDQGFQCTELQD